MASLLLVVGGGGVGGGDCGDDENDGDLRRRRPPPRRAPREQRAAAAADCLVHAVRLATLSPWLVRGFSPPTRAANAADFRHTTANAGEQL